MLIMKKVSPTIQMRLLIIVGLLNFIIAAMITNGIYASWINFQHAQQLKKGSIFVNNLYILNNSLSQARASTLALLYTPTDSANSLYLDLIKNRQNTDRYLDSLFKHFNNKTNTATIDTSDIDKKYQTLLHYRSVIDSALVAPIEKRDTAIADQYFKINSSLINEIHNFILIYSIDLKNIDATISQQMMFKHFVWELADNIGKEYAIISQIISENRTPSLEQRQALISLRGHIEYGWEILQKYSKNDELARKLLPYIEEANTQYFFTFEQINELLNDNNEPGSSAIYPISTEMWVGMSEQAVDSLLMLQEKILQETNSRVESIQLRAKRKIILSTLVFVSTLILSFYCWRTIVFRITRPIDTMINALYKATHDQNMEIHETHHQDEISKLAHVLNEFKNNAYKMKLSNEELERFAFIAAHDLKTPLRAVEMISEWLEEDLDTLLPEKSKQHMLELRNRIKLMDKLLDDTLEYSRISEKMKNTKNEPINGKELIKEIIVLLNPPTHFTINTGETLSSAQIVKFPAQQILYNLMDNAIKHHQGGNGVINLHFEESETEYIFEVSDNGPGIDARYHHKIFEMFQTLQPKGKSKGRGMGLAIVRKLINTHGGSIRLESEPGHGARFHFTLPKMRTTPGGEYHADAWRQYA